MINFMYMTNVTGVRLPIAYGNRQDEDIPSIVDILQDAIPTGYSLIWVRLPKSSSNPKLSNLLFPMLCIENEEDGSFSPIYTEAFNEGMTFDDFDDDRVAYDIILTASKYSNKVAGCIFDFEDVYTGYIMSYDAYVIRNYKKQSIKTLKASVDRLGKNIEETEDTTFESEYSKGVKIIDAMNKKLAEQKAAKGATREEAKEMPQVSTQQVEEAEDQALHTEQKQTGVAGFADTVSEEKVQQMESKVEETLKVFTKEEPEKEEEEETEEDSKDTQDNKAQPEQEATTTTVTPKETTYSYVTEESGNAIVVCDNLDSIDEQAKEVASVKELTSYNIPRFIPHTVKYELPIGVLVDGNGSKLAGMSYDDFFTCMEDYANTPDEMLINIPSAVKVAREIIHILRLENTSVTLRNLLYIFKPEDKSVNGLKVLYELLKYHTEGISPNGLYNNLYYLLYIYSVELVLTGVSDATKNYKLSSILANFVCDYKGLTLEEQSNASEDSDTFADDTEEEIVAQMFKDDVDRGNAAIAEFVTDVISGKVPFSTYFEDNDTDIKPIEKVCILATYGYFLNVHNEALARFNFKSLNMCIKPYSLLLECLAIKVDPTTLGLMLDEVNRFESRLYDTTEDGLAHLTKAQAEVERAEVYKNNQYNKTLQLLKDPFHAPYISQTTKSSVAIEELEDKSNSGDLKVFKQVFYSVTKPDGSMRYVFVGVIVEDPKKAISSRLQFYPAFSSAYMDLVQLGVCVNDLFDNEKYVPVPCYKLTSKSGMTKLMYKLPKLYSKDKSTFFVIKDTTANAQPNLLSIINIIKSKLSSLSVSVRAIKLPYWAIADKELIDEIYEKLTKQ